MNNPILLNLLRTSANSVSDPACLARLYETWIQAHSLLGRWNRIKNAVHSGHSTIFSRLERSIMSPQVFEYSKDSTVAVSSFLNDSLTTLVKWLDKQSSLQHNEVCSTIALDKRRALTASGVARCSESRDSLPPGYTRHRPR